MKTKAISPQTRRRKLQTPMQTAKASLKIMSKREDKPQGYPRNCIWHFVLCRVVKRKSLNCVWLFATPWTIQSMEFSRPEYWRRQPFPFPGYLPNPGMEPGSPTLQADSLPAVPQGKLKNTEVGSLSLLQQIFLTQELNWGLLHCRWILYQI